NVYALACGAVEGAGLGASARSALIARAFAEMARMVAAMGGSASTLTGLAGLGDLTLTCTSVQSRNYLFGMGLGRGQTVDEIMAGGPKLAEGVAATPAAQGLGPGLDVRAPPLRALPILPSGAAGAAKVAAGRRSPPPPS